MKSYLISIFAITAILLSGCDFTESQFNLVPNNLFSESEVNLKTNRIKSVQRKLQINNTITYIQGIDTTTLSIVKMTYRDAKNGVQIYKGYDFSDQTDKSFRLVYVDWKSHRTGENLIVRGSVLMKGDYQEKNDTIEVIYRTMIPKR